MAEISEHTLHAMYDAWKHLEFEAEFYKEPRRGQPSRAILRGQLKGYPPFERAISKEVTPTTYASRAPK